MIYCIQILNFKYVKFGFTKDRDLSKRISQLQTGCPFQITPVFIVEGNILQEKELHRSLEKAFGRCGIKIPPNEWYPGRTELSKHVYQMILNHNGGINHAIEVLDRYNPNVNAMPRHREHLSFDVEKEWPEAKGKEWIKIFGDQNKSKPPKIRSLLQSKRNLLR